VWEDRRLMGCRAVITRRNLGLPALQISGTRNNEGLRHPGQLPRSGVSQLQRRQQPPGTPGTAPWGGVATDQHRRGTRLRSRRGVHPQREPNRFNRLNKMAFTYTLPMKATQIQRRGRATTGNDVDLFYIDGPRTTESAYHYYDGNRKAGRLLTARRSAPGLDSYGKRDRLHDRHVTTTGSTGTTCPATSTGGG